MSDQSPRLALPYLQAAHAQKHVTHNEALQRLDLLAQLVVEAFDENAPPLPCQKKVRSGRMVRRRPGHGLASRACWQPGFRAAGCF